MGNLIISKHEAKGYLIMLIYLNISLIWYELCRTQGINNTLLIKCSCAICFKSGVPKIC